MRSPWAAAAFATAAPRTPKAPVTTILRPVTGVQQTLDDGHVGQATAFAHGLKAIATAPALEGVDQGGHQLGARGTEGVAQGDGAAIDVQLVGVDPEALQGGDRDGGEGFIDFEDVDVLDLHASLLQGALGGRKRGFQHDHRVMAHH